MPIDTPQLAITLRSALARVAEPALSSREVFLRKAGGGAQKKGRRAK
jgi:hypothetical protein